MHAVWVTNEAAVEPRTGGGLRSQRLLTALAAEIPVDVVALGSALDTTAYVDCTGATTATVFPPSRRGRTRVALTAIREMVPVASARWHSTDAATRVRELLTPTSVVVLEHAVLLPYLPRGQRFVLVLHNIDSVLTRDISTASALERRWSAAMFARIERMASVSSRALAITVSDKDAKALPGPSVVVPNGADLPADAPDLPVAGRVVFVGSMGYPPNAEAVRWWTTDVWPQSVGRRPLTVIGSQAESNLADLAAEPSVDIVGEVVDVGPHLAGASAVAIPLLSGGGTRLKLLEALAWGRPVITTSKGAEGLPVVDGSSVLIADTASAFAKAVDRVLDDRELALRLSAEGRLLAERFAWPRLTPTFVEAVREFAAGSCP